MDIKFIAGYEKLVREKVTKFLQVTKFFPDFLFPR